MSGLWDDESVPKLGWECLEVYDSLDDGDHDELWFTCQMCTTTHIRYVHVMAHASFEGELHCGCICAGHMEGDGDRASRRESLARRRQRFPDHSNWSYQLETDWRTGLSHLNRNRRILNVEHHRLEVKQIGDGHWIVSIVRPGPDHRAIVGKKRYASEREAQMGAFDALIWSQEKLQ